MTAKRDFTDRFLRALKPAPVGKRVIHWDAQITGFGIRVTDHSTEENRGAFVLVSRYPGSSNPTARRIGDYPSLSLAKAREIARQWREDLRQAIDPKVKEAERRREEERKRVRTFGAVFDAFASDRLAELRTGDAVLSVVKRHVYPKWGERPIAEIRRYEVNDLIRNLRKDIPIGANRLLAYLKTFFSWAADQELIEASPAAAVKRPTKERKRDRVLTDLEIRAIWEACAEMGAFGRAFRFMLVTGQRRSEVGDMTWREIDRMQKVWAIGRERTKADRAHEVPLSALATSIVEECPRLGDFVFSTGRSSTAAGQRGRAVSLRGWSKAKSRLDEAALEKARAVAEQRGEEPPVELIEWHLHDFRRTAATYMAKLGVDRVVIGKVLNHAEREVTAIYDRHRYDLEKRRALELWGERLNAIINETGQGILFRWRQQERRGLLGG